MKQKTLFFLFYLVLFLSCDPTSDLIGFIRIKIVIVTKECKKENNVKIWDSEWSNYYILLYY